MIIRSPNAARLPLVDHIPSSSSAPLLAREVMIDFDYDFTVHALYVLNISACDIS